MQISLAGSRSELLPVTRSLTSFYALSILIAAITSAASAAGLLFSDRYYPSEELHQAFLVNDLTNLLIAVPILLGAMWLTHRGRLVGLLLWPGAFLYGVYNYNAYMFALPLSLPLLAAIALTVLGGYATLGLMLSMDAGEIRRRLADKVAVKPAGIVVAVLGLLFLLRSLGILVAAVVNQEILPEAEVAVTITDALLAPAWLIGGILLWRRQAWGYAIGPALLFVLSMLFAGLLLFLLLQPLLTQAPFAPVDVAVVAIMALPCVIPLVLLVRATADL